MRRRFLFFCSVIMLCMFCAHDSFAVIHHTWRGNINDDSYDIYNMCREELDGFCTDDLGGEFVQDTCDSSNQELSTACKISERDPYYLLEYPNWDYSCQRNAHVYRIFSCTSCYSGATAMPLWQLCRDDGSLPDGVDLSGSTYADVKTLVDFMTEGGSCGDNYVNNNIKVCVKCQTTVTYSGWQLMGTSNRVKREITTTGCGQTETTTEYACAANTYYYNGTGEGTACRPCPDHATCTQQDGHTNKFTCRGDWTKNGTGTGCELVCGAGKYNGGTDFCLSCPAGTYQPNESNTGDVTSCLSCPAGTYQPNTKATSCLPCAAGTYQPNTKAASCLSCAVGKYQPDTGATSCLACPGYINRTIVLTDSEATELKTQCYINAGEEVEYSDASGDYVVEGDADNKCYYTEVVLVNDEPQIDPQQNINDDND